MKHRHVAVLALLLVLLVVTPRGSAQSLVTLQYATSDCSGPVITATATATNLCFSVPLLSRRVTCSANTYSSTVFEGVSCSGSVVDSMSQLSQPLNQCSSSSTGSTRSVCDGSADAQLAAAVWSTVNYGTSSTSVSVCTNPPYMATYQISSCVATGYSWMPSTLYNCSQQVGAQTTSFTALGCEGGVYSSLSETVNSCSYNSQVVCGYVALATPPFWYNPLFVPIVSAGVAVVVVVAVVTTIVCCVRSRRRRMAMRRAAAQASLGVTNTPYVALQGGVMSSAHAREQPQAQYMQSDATTYAAPIAVVRT